MERVAPAVLSLPVFLYCYFYIRRFFFLYGSRKFQIVQKTACVLLSLALTAPIADIWGLGAMIVLHLAAAGVILDLVRILIEKIFHRRNLFWYRVCCSGVIPVLMTLVILGYGYLNMRQITAAEYTVQSQKKLDRTYDIVFLSDLHFGTTMDSDRLTAVCRKIKEGQPDLVILGGDIVDEHTGKEEMEEAFQILGGIENSTFGIYYVYGNHDQGKYRQDTEFTPEELAKAAKNSGINVLEDETVMLSPQLTLTGRKDRTNASREQEKRASAKELLKELPENAYHILADHQPRYFEKNAEAGYDLMLSGHTHGGQIWPVGLLTEIFDRKTFNYGQKNVDGMEVIVSSGLGGWNYPIRTGKHSEYVVVHLRDK